MKDPASWITDDWHGGVEGHRRDRAEKGYSRADLINFDTHLAWVIASGARELAEITHGYPANLAGGADEWHAILNKIADGFEGWLHYEADNSGKYSEVSAALNESLDLFKQYFMALWD